MPRIVYVTVIVAALLVLALGGWTVQGLRKLGAAARLQPRRRLAPSA